AFNFGASGSVTNINGGAGSDSIDLSNLAAASVSLATSSANGYSGTSNRGVTNFSNIDSLTSAAGGTLSSSLTAATAWTISASQAGTVTNSTFVLNFAGFNTLNGGSGADSLDFSALSAV